MKMKMKDAMDVTGLTRRAIGHYEAEGLIRPNRGTNKYRVFSEDDVNTLKEIQYLKSLGMNLSNISEVLKSDNKDELINKFIVENLKKIKNNLDLQIKNYEKVLGSKQIENILNSCNKEEIQDESNTLSLDNNISLNPENTKYNLNKIFNYILDKDLLDELLIITQYNTKDILNFLDNGIIPARLANYLVSSLNIGLDALVGVRKLNKLEKIGLSRK